MASASAFPIISESAISGGSITNPTLDASRLQLYCSSTDVNKGITVTGTSTSYMTIYAPGTDVTLSGGSGLFGAVVSKTFSGTGGADVHYDKYLANADNLAGGGAPVWSRVPNSYRLSVVH